MTGRNAVDKDLYERAQGEPVADQGLPNNKLPVLIESTAASRWFGGPPVIPQLLENTGDSTDPMHDQPGALRFTGIPCMGDVFFGPPLSTACICS